MTIEWCVNSKTGEIFDYVSEGEHTDFPRGTFLAYHDYLTTGLKSKEEAEKWSLEWSVCNNCKCDRHGKDGERCRFCGSVLVNYFVKGNK